MVCMRVKTVQGFADIHELWTIKLSDLCGPLPQVDIYRNALDNFVDGLPKGTHVPNGTWSLVILPIKFS